MKIAKRDFYIFIWIFNYKDIIMSSIDCNASISVQQRLFSENPRVGNHKGIAVELGKLRTSEQTKLSSPLKEWMQQGGSPFSFRQLATAKEHLGNQKNYAGKSLTDILIAMRHEFTVEGYRSIMDVTEMISQINEEIEQSSLLTLRTRDKNVFQERLVHYQEHMKWVLNGIRNAKFPESVRIGIEQVKRELAKTLEAVDAEIERIKIELNPKLGGAAWLRV